MLENNLNWNVLFSSIPIDAYSFDDRTKILSIFMLDKKFFFYSFDARIKILKEMYWSRQYLSIGMYCSRQYLSIGCIGVVNTYRLTLIK